jgi:hypothetical protein
MNRFLVVSLLFVCSWAAFSQNTPPIGNYPKPNPVTAFVPVKLFSSHPSVQEIAAVFGRAGAEGVEPITIVQQLISGGGAVVPVLVNLITPDSMIPPSQLADSGNVARPPLPNRVLAIYALDGIGSVDAYTALMQIGASHREVEIRAASLNALANSYLDKVKSGMLRADTGVVHTFLRHVDDAAEVTSLRHSVANISREGLRRWLNLDLGTTIQSEYSLAVDKVPQTLSSADYWEYWWSVNSPNLVWTTNVGKFLLSK